jgi:hypothetical protein
MLYEIHVTSSDPLGINFIRNIVDIAKKGGDFKENEVVRLAFPHHCKMILESDVEPIPDPQHRVFEVESGKEVRIKKIEATPVQTEGGAFIMEVDPALATTDSGARYTKEQLDALDWNEFKIVLKADEITGRDRNKMTTQYLANSAK